MNSQVPPTHWEGFEQAEGWPAVDPSEGIRRMIGATINSLASTEEADRKRLEAEFGADNVWTTSQLRERFEVVGFMAPYCVVVNRATGEKGSVMFQHYPRFYFGWQKDEPSAYER